MGGEEWNAYLPRHGRFGAKYVCFRSRKARCVRSCCLRSSELPRVYSMYYRYIIPMSTHHLLRGHKSISMEDTMPLVFPFFPYIFVDEPVARNKVVRSAGFPQTSIWRPGLLGRGSKARTVEKIARFLVTPVRHNAVGGRGAFVILNLPLLYSVGGASRLEVPVCSRGGLE